MFYGSNLTPDAETGLGTWSEADFLRAMQRGRSPDGHAYWPAFPYPSFTGMSESDLKDLWAFLQTLEPVSRPNEPHDLSGPTSWRVSRSLWRAFFFDAGAFEPPKDASEEWARGAYLVRHVGHCGDCHTPRGGLGQVKQRHEFEGSDGPPVPSPPITVGTLGWTADDYDSLLSLGMLPDGDFVGGGMTHVVDDGTTHLSDADRAAMIVYLQSVE